MGGCGGGVAVLGDAVVVGWYSGEGGCRVCYGMLRCDSMVL